MIYITSVLAAVLCSSATSDVQNNPKQSLEQVSSFKLGKSLVEGVRSDYENGKYNQFLIEMDLAYKNADLKKFIEKREGTLPENFDEKWAEEFSSLQRKKNQALMDALAEDDESIFAKKVRSLSSNLLTPEQEKSIARLNNFITLKPNQGKNLDENTLIDIDLEYEYKLDYAHSQDSSLDQEKQIALRMEKMDKMAQAAKNFEDQELKQAVGIAAATLDARLARNLDGADLNRWAKNRKKGDKQEELVYSILQDYQGQFSDLIKELR